MADTITTSAPSLLATLPATIQSHPLLVASSGLLAYATLTRSGNFQSKALISLIIALIAGIIGVICGLVLMPLGRGGYINLIVARFFDLTLGNVMGIHFKVVEGQKYLDENPAVFVANHQSSMDVLMLGAVFPKDCAVVAKAEMKWYPFLGQFSKYHPSRNWKIDWFVGVGRELKCLNMGKWI
ncbi:hypothetical protein BC937DRAFT_86769 [Endogone sp. FLAS-F59071]|nr:hypothetical protein BC937DRAFT_86769 [Endogone sp. FLAS-F59071]|eukprot:RUS12894.1 hypothetical protein BC937DRAFT_86769 [Endogone sp. FLAS-F59071]